MAEYSEYEWDSRCRTNLTRDISHKEPLKNRSCAVQIIQNQLHDSEELKGFSTDEKNITRFLCCRKYDIPETLKLIQNYHKFREKHKELFEITPYTKQALRDGFPIVLKERDRKGRCVLVLFSANWDTSAYPILEIHRALLYSLDKLTRDSVNQMCGFVLIVDWSGLTFTQSSKLNIKLMLSMIEGLQNTFPVRIKGCHFVDQPWYVETAMTMIKPILNEKSRKRLYLHGNNLATLHEHVPIDVLPTELGGEGPPLDTAKWALEILGPT